MGKKLSGPDHDLYQRVDEVLFYLWDPIGVNNSPGARDEYHSYLPQVFSLLKKETHVDDIAQYLHDVERDAMGLNVTSESFEHGKKIASLLLEHKEWIESKSALNEQGLAAIGPVRVVGKKLLGKVETMKSIFDKHYFTRKNGDLEFFREIEVDGPMLTTRSGTVGCKLKEVLEETKLVSDDVELFRTWKKQVEIWRNEGFFLSERKKIQASKKSPPKKDPGHTLTAIISAIDGKLTDSQKNNFAPPPPLTALQQLSEYMGMEIPIFLKELYSWRGGCEDFLPDDIDWNELSQDYAGSNWLTIDEAAKERESFLNAWAKREKPFEFKESWLLIFGSDGNGYAVDLSTKLADPLLIDVDHEVGARQTEISLCDALRRVYFAIENNAWIPDDPID